MADGRIVTCNADGKSSEPRSKVVKVQTHEGPTLNSVIATLVGGVTPVRRDPVSWSSSMLFHKAFELKILLL